MGVLRRNTILRADPHLCLAVGQAEERRSRTPIELEDEPRSTRKKEKTLHVNQDRNEITHRLPNLLLHRILTLSLLWLPRRRFLACVNPALRWPLVMTLFSRRIYHHFRATYRVTTCVCVWVDRK